MADSQSTRPPHGGKPNILSRDRDGIEHRLGVVDHPAGLVTLYDSHFVRILAPGSAIALALALIRATHGADPGSGPISAAF